MKNTAVLLVLFVSSLSLAQAKPTVYLEPQQGFETYIAAAIEKKACRLMWSLTRRKRSTSSEENSNAQGPTTKQSRTEETEATEKARRSRRTLCSAAQIDHASARQKSMTERAT